MVFLDILLGFILGKGGVVLNFFCIGSFGLVEKKMNFIKNVGYL